MENFLKVALQASKVAGEIIMQHYSAHNFSVTIKADQTPVTEVDVAVEQAIKKLISKEFPTHGFYGEEEGQQDINAEYVWLIDPIDGTKAFVRARPFFSCQIALYHKGEIILGVSNAPAYNGGECIYAAKGQGAFLNNQALKIANSQLKDAVLSSGNIKSLSKDSQKWQNYSILLQAVSSTRGFGDFLHYHLLAAGKIDLVLESDVTILDIAALSIIVQEAGGVVTDLSGAPLTLKSSSILAAHPQLHDRALEILHKPA